MPYVDPASNILSHTPKVTVDSIFSSSSSSLASPSSSSSSTRARAQTSSSCPSFPPQLPPLSPSATPTLTTTSAPLALLGSGIERVASHDLTPRPSRASSMMDHRHPNLHSPHIPPHPSMSDPLPHSSSGSHSSSSSSAAHSHSATDTGADADTEGLSATLASARIFAPSFDSLSSTSPTTPSYDTDRDSGMSASESASASSVSIQSLASEDGNREVAVARYSAGVYSYTHGLYIQAKLAAAFAQKKRNSTRNSPPESQFGQFGAKKSGMEKMAAKKALARRLNA